MSSTLSRLILAVTFLFAVPVVYTILFSVIETTVLRDDTKALMAASVICAPLLAVTWPLIWIGIIRWTPQRLALTVGAFFWSIVPAVAVYLITITAGRYLREAAVLFAGMIWAVTWLASTAIIWRETGDERAQHLSAMGVNAIACPKCGYNMTGLRQPVCPECGAKYTLDQLYAACLEQRDDQRV